jgi:hypothetical protein
MELDWTGGLKMKLFERNIKEGSKFRIIGHRDNKARKVVKVHPSRMLVRLAGIKHAFRREQLIRILS